MLRKLRNKGVLNENVYVDAREKPNKELLLTNKLSAAIINVIVILLLLNFVFNRKSDKKKMICAFVISLVMFGIGIGLVMVGALDFEYIENDKDILKTECIEFDMKDDLIVGYYIDEIEYI